MLNSFLSKWTTVHVYVSYMISIRYLNSVKIFITNLLLWPYLDSQNHLCGQVFQTILKQKKVILLSRIKHLLNGTVKLSFIYMHTFCWYILLTSLTKDSHHQMMTISGKHWSSKMVAIVSSLNNIYSTSIFSIPIQHWWSVLCLSVYVQL